MSRSLLRHAALFAAPLAAALSASVICGAATAGPLAAAVSDKPYTVTIDKVAAQKDKPAIATVLIKPGAGYHLNKEFPTTLKLKPPADINVANPNLATADAKLTEQKGSFEVKFTATGTGSKQIPGELRFAVCTDTTCEPQKTAVTLEVEVR